MSDKLIKDEEEGLDQGQQGGQTAGSVAPNTISGQGSNVVGSGQVSTGGIGAGGQGSWTNIQAYMNANKNDDRAAGMLDSKVGGEFGKERSNIQNESSKLINQGKQNVGQLWTQDDARNRASTAANQYRWQVGDNSYAKQLADVQRYQSRGGSLQGMTPDDYAKSQLNKEGWTRGPNQAYDSSVGEVKEYLGRKYTGPREYTYGIGGEAQRLAGSLKSDDSYNQLMGDLYAERTNSPLNSGQRALQRQLNLSNTALQGARDRLMNDFSDLTKFRDETAKSTSDELAGLESGLRTSQNELTDLFRQMQGQANTDRQMAENQRRTELQRRLNESNRYDYTNVTPDTLDESRWRDGLSGALNFHGQPAADLPGRNKDVGLQQRQMFNTIADFLGTNDARLGRYYDITQGGSWNGKKHADEADLSF